MKLYFNGKKTTSKFMKAKVGDGAYMDMLKEAKAAFKRNPDQEIFCWAGTGVLSFEFKAKQ